MGVLQGLLSNNGYLYAAWKGQPNDDRLFYSRWNGTGTWSLAAPMGDGTVTGNSSVGPSLGSLNGTMYAAWKGEYSDPRLFFAKHDGSNWRTQKQIPNAYSDVGPALCGFGQNLIAAWKNVFDQNLYFATYDGSHSKWSAPSPIPGVASSVGPSLATYGQNQKLYAVWKGAGTDQSLWYAMYDGRKWSGQTQGSSQTLIPGVGSSVGASLASVGSKLYAVWKGEGTDQSLYCAEYDGNKWSGLTSGSSQTQIPGSGSSVGAAIAEFGDKLYAMCKGKDSDASLYNADFANGAWHGWANDISGNTGPDTETALVTLPSPKAANLPGSSNYFLVDSGGGGKYLTNAGVIVLVAEDIVPSSNENYSFQMNCGSSSNLQQQYGFRVANNVFFFWVNVFRDFNQTKIEWDSTKPPYQYTWPLPNNILPKGWQFTVNLATEPNKGHVTGVSFTLANNDNVILLTTPSLGLTILTSGATPIINTDDESSIDSFASVLVGENAGETTRFASGQGIFCCYATNNLIASNAVPLLTKEQSNISYSSLPKSYPNGEFYQLFGLKLAP